MLFRKNLLVSCLLAASANALAATPANLSVTGRILPQGCDIRLGAGGPINLGKVSTKDLNPVGVTILPEVHVPFNITCTGPVLIATAWTDNKASDGVYRPSDSRFSLGKDTAESPIGALDIRHGPYIPVTGGVGTQAFTILRNPGGDWSGSVEGYVSTTRIGGFAAPGTGAIPRPYTTYGGNLALKPIIAPLNTLHLVSELDMGANVTVELIYL